jgi:hypothetical protein
MSPEFVKRSNAPQVPGFFVFLQPHIGQLIHPVRKGSRKSK